MNKVNQKLISGTLTVLALNNIALIVSALAIVGCLTVAQRSEWLYVSCMIVGILACAFSRCAGEGEKLSFTKDWIVVMAQREHNPGLSSEFSLKYKLPKCNIQCKEKRVKIVDSGWKT